jgi:hypothetical protein
MAYGDAIAENIHLMLSPHLSSEVLRKALGRPEKKMALAARTPGFSGRCSLVVRSVEKVDRFFCKNEIMPPEYHHDPQTRMPGLDPKERDKDCEGPDCVS